MKALKSLVALLGDTNVNQDAADCRLYSEDIAGPATNTVMAIVRPTDSDLLAATVRWAFDNHISVLIRGGGMSYTSGYLPERAGCIVLDMTAMHSVVSITTHNNSVAVQAGCTWATLHDALSAENLRTPFFGPLSGQVATVGGAVSQNSAFYGSARYGTVRDQVLGVELVDGQGQRLWVGEDESGHVHKPGSIGEDWRDMLVGDAGVFGVKTQLVLKTIPMPRETRFFSFAFDQAQHVIHCMTALNKVPQLADVYAFDRITHQNLSRSGFSVLEATQLARDLVTQSGSVLKAAGAMIQGAKLGKVRLAECAWTLHLAMDLNEHEQTLQLDRDVIDICLSHDGTAIPNTIPSITRARPFRSISALVGPDGERWLPCHGVFAAERAELAMRKLASWFTNQSTELARYEIRVSTLLARVGADIILEPQFFWPDELSVFQRAYARPEQIRQFTNNPPNPKTRERVRQLRAEIRDLFIAEGARFMQLGKYYPWTHKLGPISEQQALVFKNQMDPSDIINPGALRF